MIRFYLLKTHGNFHQSNTNENTVSALSYFFCNVFLDYCGCLVCCETDIVKFLVNFDQINVKEEPLKCNGERVDFDGQINQKMYEILTE